VVFSFYRFVDDASQLQDDRLLDAKDMDEREQIAKWIMVAHYQA
jgi:hypothetical protein